MGQCIGLCCKESTFQYKVALKFPNGTNGIFYNETQQWNTININQWIQSLYNDSQLTRDCSFILYNDETSGIKIESTHKKGHCKGILAWNKKKITWLIHSVPNFPREFTGDTISEIELGETIYGQSFCYIEHEYNEEFLKQLISHVLKMEPNIFKTKGIEIEKKKCESIIHTLQVDEFVTHIVKPHHFETDIYHYLAELVPTEWYIETWIRGKAIMTPHKNINEIQMLQFGDIQFQESQDHSKWAVTDEYVWIGDLNRMTSQFHRGGGGVLIKNKKLVAAFRSLIQTTKQLSVFPK